MVVQAIDNPGKVGLIANVYRKGCTERTIGAVFHPIQLSLKKGQEFRGGPALHPDPIRTGSCKKYGTICFERQNFTLRGPKVVF